MAKQHMKRYRAMTAPLLVPALLLGLLLSAALPVTAQDGGTSCPPALDLHPGDRAHVAYADGTGGILRDYAGLDAPVQTVLPEGIFFTIEGTAVCADNLNWWPIEVAGWNLAGWLAETLSTVDGTIRQIEPAPPTLPEGVRPLLIATLDAAGRLGLYRSEEGWSPLASYGAGAAVAFNPSGTQVYIGYEDRLDVRSLGTGGLLRAYDWTALTGQEDVSFSQLAASQDGSALLWTLAGEACDARGLWRFPLGADEAEVLLPADTAVRLEGPMGETARAVFTPTGIYPLEADGYLGEALLDWSVPIVERTADLPPLTWSLDGATIYLPLPGDDAELRTIAYYALTVAGGTDPVEPLPRVWMQLPGQWGAVAPDGVHILVQNVVDGVEAWRVYAGVSPGLLSEEIVAEYPLEWRDVQWTPDGLGLLARESADDGYAYYGLDGATTSPYLPDLPDIEGVLYLADGTLLFRTHATEGEWTWSVLRPGLEEPIRIREGEDVYIAAVLLQP